MYSNCGYRLPDTVGLGIMVGVFLAAMNAIVPSALAHGASPRKIDEKIEIAAKPEAVWAIMGNFANIATWNPLVASSVAESDARMGKERVITFKSGGKVTDAVTEYNAGKMTYSYIRADENVKDFPVSFYSATISLSPTATGTEVEWIGRFYRGDTSNEPPPNLTDEAATKAMTDFFEAGLNNIKKLAEKK